MSNIVLDHFETLGPKKALLATPEGRRSLTKYSFKTFCFVYFRDIMQSSDTGGQISLSEFHADFMEDALRFTQSAGPAESRTAWVAPRGSAKSTMIMMLVLWLSAHKFQRFVAIFSATTPQSESMLANIRGQFTSNELLIKDYPELVTPATRRNVEMKLSDNKQLIIQKNGFVCTGRSIDSSVLGMRVDNTRPTMIILDDIEGGEENFSAAAAQKRLITLQDDIFPLSLNAHVVWVGTTTRPAGLAEGLVHTALGMEHPAWVDEENFVVNYRPALRTHEDGSKHSIWPERWTTEFLLSQEHTRSFKKNYMCLPASEDYAYWTPDDFKIGDATAATRTLISVDPAVTTSRTSDFTGLAVVSYSPVEGKCYVHHAEQVKMTGADLRKRVLQLCEMYPQVKVMLNEVNMGGNIWQEIFHDMPIKYITKHQTVKKEVRAAAVLNYYQTGKVQHAAKLPALEDQMVSFPRGAHDDMVDAVGSAVEYFMTPPASKQVSTGKQVRYAR